MKVEVELRKKPRQQRSSGTVSYILDGATRILTTQGLAAFNTNAIAELAGVSVGSLYQFFPSKDAIMAALLLREREHAAVTLRSLVDRAQHKQFDVALLQLLKGVRENESPALLTRILELEHPRLPDTTALQAVKYEIAAAQRVFFSRYVSTRQCSAAQLDVAARDVICIVGAMRAAAAASDDDWGSDDLDQRILRTIRGYMQPFLSAHA